jgi:GNAT superfamily N-acetyltransferase
MLFAGRAALGTEHRNVFRAVGGKTNPYRTRAVEPQLKSRTLSSCFAHIFGATEIERLVVTPERRREGIGTRLMRCVLDEAARQGAQRATTVIRSNDEIAHKFCEHFRFNAMGTREVNDTMYFLMDRISERAVMVR